MRLWSWLVAKVRAREGFCATCGDPITGKRFPYSTCSDRCADERWATVNS